MSSEFSHLDSTGAPSMVDVSAKAPTRRTAIARAKVRLSLRTLELLKARALPKGDVLTVAQVAGIMAAKRTSELIPLCHPLALSHADVRFLVRDDLPGVLIEASASTSDRTGVEMEAIVAAQVAAATIYDMVKAVQKDVVIDGVRLIYKSGGKSGLFCVEKPLLFETEAADTATPASPDAPRSDAASPAARTSPTAFTSPASPDAAPPHVPADALPAPIPAPEAWQGEGLAVACITLSDKGYRGEREDESGPALLRMLEELAPAHARSFLLPDAPEALRLLVQRLAHSGWGLIVSTGGTGLSPRDTTPEALIPALDRRLPGFEQVMFAEGLKHTPRAILSRCLAGTVGSSLVLALPGSRKAAEECLSAVLPVLAHALEKLGGDMNDCGRH